MKHQEKKYRVASFTPIKRILEKLGIVPKKEVVTTHYYCQHQGNDVVKLVKYDDRNEIHLLKEKAGKFTLDENIPVKSTQAGLSWLKNKGCKIVNLVKTANTDYEYKDGIVGLYVIDDWLLSVILDYQEDRHEAMEKEFGLTRAERIELPYNKQLGKIGKLRSMKLT